MGNDRKKIIISAYALSPYKGSEFGAAWNAVINLATQHDLFVLYGSSDDHMGETQTMSEFLKTNSIPGVTFIEVLPGALAMRINMLNKLGLVWFFYVAIYIWHRKAYNMAREIMQREKIDIVHQLGPIGFREPGFLWKIDKPFVWGPIGGTNLIDTNLVQAGSYMTRFKFNLKNTINRVQIKYAARIEQAMKRADALIAATRTDQLTIRTRYHRESFHLSEQAVLSHAVVDYGKFASINDSVSLVWSGSHIERKNLGMLLQALGKVQNKNWILHVLGNGKLTEQWKKTAESLGISSNITWHGQIKRNEAIQVMASAHLHLITSIAEGNPAVLFESLSYGVPTLTLDHCGMGDVICQRCGIKISVESYDQVVETMSVKLQNIFENPKMLIDLATGTVECAQQFTWDKRLVQLNRLYDNAINHWSEGKRSAVSRRPSAFSNPLQH